MVTFQIEKKARFTTAEQARDFDEQLASKIAGFLEQGFHVRAVWTDPDGKLAEEILIKKEDLNSRKASHSNTNTPTCSFRSVSPIARRIS